MSAAQGSGPYYYVRVKHERPLGVALLAVIIGLFGALFTIVGLLLMLASAFLGVYHPTLDFGFHLLTSSLLVAGLFLLIFGVIMLALASGLWHLEQWALVLSIIVFGILFILDLLSGSLTAILWGLLLVYLVLVRNHFT